jgi:arylsulfatase A-like enzyme
MAPFNILYLHSHDTGRLIQPLGHAVSTPNLQQLAEDGMLFRQAHCAGPTCSPSRAALLTGQAPHSNGMMGLAHLGFQLNDYEHHLVHTLQQHGYTTALAGHGSQHVAPNTEMIGYDHFLDIDGPDKAAQTARFLGGDPPEPFFLSVGFGDTHRTFAEPEHSGPDTDPRFAAPPRPIADTPTTRRDMAGFNTSCRALDRHMGTVLEGLEKAGLAENTLVICTTDHGPAFPRMKCNTNEAGTGVFLIIRGPRSHAYPEAGTFAGGRVSDGLVSQIDVFPTLCELLDIERPNWLHGSSLMPLVRGETNEVNEAVFSEVTYHVCYDPQRSVRTNRYRYIRRFGERVHPCIPNCDDGPSKDAWLEAGWAEMELPEEQLYDSVFDPNEQSNLAGDPSHADILGEMRERLRQWMEETDDPLLQGPVSPPSGARLIDPDSRSNRDGFYEVP